MGGVRVAGAQAGWRLGACGGVPGGAAAESLITGSGQRLIVLWVAVAGTEALTTVRGQCLSAVRAMAVGSGYSRATRSS